MKKTFFIAVIALATLAGCYYDKSDEINIGAGLFTPCDTTHPVSYAHHIVPIMQNYCYSCHSGANPSSGFHLETYADVKREVDNGNLVARVSHDNHVVSVSDFMPPGNFQLDSCYLKQIWYWADTLGAPNN